MWFVTAPIEVISKTHRLSDTFVFCFFFTTLASAVTRSMSTVEKGHRFFPQHPPSLSGSLQLQVPAAAASVPSCEGVCVCVTRPWLSILTGPSLWPASQSSQPIGPPTT